MFKIFAFMLWEKFLLYFINNTILAEEIFKDKIFNFHFVESILINLR